jgi:hypothetical protein
VPATFVYQTTDPASNLPTGSPSTPVDIPAGAAQTFVIAFTPTGSIPAALPRFSASSVDIELAFSCANTAPAASVSGLNTFRLTACSEPVADYVAVAPTTTQDGIVTIDGALGVGIFAIARDQRRRYRVRRGLLPAGHAR